MSLHCIAETLLASKRFVKKEAYGTKLEPKHSAKEKVKETKDAR